MNTSLAGKKILVVEDEYFIASDVKRVLTAHAAIVVGPVCTAAQGRSLLDTERPDAAVLDINLDGSLSYGLADELAVRGIPFLFVTGYDAWALRDAYRDVVRVAKPFSRATLVASLEALLVEETVR